MSKTVTVLVPVYVSPWHGQWACDQAAASKADDQAWDVEWGTIGQNKMPRPAYFGSYGGYKPLMVSAGPQHEMRNPRHQGDSCRSISPRSSHSQSQISTDDVSSDAMQSTTSASVGDSYEPPRARKTASNGTLAGRHKMAAAPESEAVISPPKPLVEWRRSVGSAGHEEGLCKRCAFYSKGRCRNGDDCTHCHLNHEHRRSRHRRRHEEAQLTEAERTENGDQNEERNEDEADAREVDGGMPLGASPQPCGWSPVLPSNTQVDSSLVFGMVTPPPTAEKQPQDDTAEAAAPSGQEELTSSSAKSKSVAFDALLRG